MVPAFVSMIVWLAGCSVQPVFGAVSAITIHTQTPSGTSRDELSGDQLEKAASCLYESVEIKQADAKTELLQEILLIQVKDRYGDRMYEFVTTENFTGDKGKFYQNRCIFTILKGIK